MATDGEYIVNRLLPDIVRATCREQGIEFESFSDDWILRLEQNGIQHWIFGYTFSLNNASSTEVANDKVAAYQALAAKNLSVVEHYLARSRASKNVLMDNLANIPANQSVLTKPLEGASGHGIHLFPNVQEATEFLAAQYHTDWTISPWYDIASETRFIICDGMVLACYEKHGATYEDGLKFYNLGKGARALDTAPDPAKTQLALNATQTLGLRLAAVDIVIMTDGDMRILEVNAGIMMEHYARQSEEYKNRAEKVYSTIVEKMFE